ncbi:formate/nitrite transporter family protein [Brevibacillus dissolubilis]|uniref:formate/nitrite transporter family protein n=1 Tax=Brevibacillus dissolubilis TaxID=1844116 RepID=UPI001115C5EC|nr:formate/nitrite transporter family protein [Brevibacillus dissolubilis]
MSYHTPQRVAEIAIDAGTRKAHLPLPAMLVLGFLGGAFIALGFLLDIRVIGNVPKEWGSFASFLGAAVFPVGLILVVIAGGELLTGNMMAVSMAALAKKITVGRLLHNWFWITLTNFLGALFVAYFFGHLVGLTETGPFLAKTTAITHAKLEENFVQSLISGIGCNWMVALAVWMSYAADSIGGKIIAIWFPIMGFVAIGFQHVVANMFLIPAAIFAGQATWGDWLANFIPVWIGNAIGGTVFVSMIYWVAYIRGVEKKA